MAVTITSTHKFGSVSFIFIIGPVVVMILTSLDQFYYYPPLFHVSSPYLHKLSKK